MSEPRRTRKIAACLGSVLLLGACKEEDVQTRETGDPPPPPSTSTTSATSTSETDTAASEDDASSGEPCFLAAAVDPFLGAPPANFECRTRCVEPHEVTAWCESEASCCDGATCNADGLCVHDDVQTASGTD